MDYHVKLDMFEGPLDLLLHLISKAKIKIEDVSITEITEQYLEYLDRMKEFDVEIASEFLVMAATLLYIKSRSLLPKPKDEEQEESDPEQDLIRRLAEYKKYKEASEKLRQRENIYSNIYYKLPEELVDDKAKNSSTLIEGDVNDLVLAFLKLMSQRKFQKNEISIYPIIRRSITVSQRIREIKKILTKTSQCSFFQLLEDSCHRSDVVVTFLALLEMLKDNQIRIYQQGQFEDIIIRRASRGYGRT